MSTVTRGMVFTRAVRTGLPLTGAMILRMALLLLLIGTTGEVRAHEEDPWFFNDKGRAGGGETAIREKQPTAEGNGGALQTFLRGFFQAVSNVDGDRCPMTPTCSTYSLQAMARHSLILGWIMTVDRLIRESDEQRYCPWVLMDGSWHCLDPVEANDAWWASPERLDK